MTPGLSEDPNGMPNGFVGVGAVPAGAGASPGGALGSKSTTPLGPAHTIAVDDSGSAQTCPLGENRPDRHVPRAEGDPAGIELQIDWRLVAARQRPAEQNRGGGQDTEQSHEHPKYTPLAAGAPTGR
jgi:hypothetical protein